MRRPVLLLAILAALFLTASASASWSTPLHVGVRGQRVKDAQYLLKGHNHFRLRTYGGRITGYYGRPTARATRRAKFRLGYPRRALTGRFGAELYEYLRGQAKLPSAFRARRWTRLTLHVGARGQRVKDAQWLMQGHNHFRLRTYPGRINGRYTQATSTAAWWAKFRLGYPRSLENGSFGPRLSAFLRGRAKLPAGYRLRRIKRAHVQNPGRSLSGFATYARKTVGTRYRWGGVDPFNGGADCSGLVQYLYSRYWSKFIPRTSESQFYGGLRLSRPSQIGDLIFYYGIPPGHVTMYLGNGQMIQDPHTGASVYVSAVRPGYVGVRRYLPSYLPGNIRASGLLFGLPWWAAVISGLLSITLGLAGVRAFMRRIAREAAHEVGELADDLEAKLDDRTP